MSAVAPHLPDSRVLDLFAGSGALGIEALSRGAEHATFVESATPALRILEENLAELEVPRQRVTVVRSDAIRYVEALPRAAFDLVFADPPYGRGYATRLAERFADTPFARILVIEHGRDEPLPEAVVDRQRRYGDTMLTFLSFDDDRST